MRVMTALVVAAATLVVLGGCGSDGRPVARFAPGLKVASPPPSDRVAISADKDGRLIWDQTEATALSGAVAVTVENRSRQFHNVTIVDPRQQPPKGWPPPVAQDVLPTSSSFGPGEPLLTEQTIVVDLEPGDYQLVCSVLGHAQAGMQIPLRIVASERPADASTLPVGSGTANLGEIPTNRVTVTADPGGKPRWRETVVTARAGRVEVDLDNPSPIPQHLVVFRSQDGAEDYLSPDTEIVARAKTAVIMDLDPGRYWIGSLVNPVERIPFDVR